MMLLSVCIICLCLFDVLTTVHGLYDVVKCLYDFCKWFVYDCLLCMYEVVMCLYDCLFDVSKFSYVSVWSYCVCELCMIFSRVCIMFSCRCMIILCGCMLLCVFCKCWPMCFVWCSYVFWFLYDVIKCVYDLLMFVCVIFLWLCMLYFVCVCFSMCLYDVLKFVSDVPMCLYGFRLSYYDVIMSFWMMFVCVCFICITRLIYVCTMWLGCCMIV